MKLLKLICLFTLLSSSAFSQYQNYEVSGSEYFNLFDYNNSKLINRMMEVESKLVLLSKDIQAYLEQNPKYKAPSKKFSSTQKLAYTLVYTGMILMNNNNGAIEKLISINHLTQHLNLSNSKNLQTEIKLRYELAEEFLKLARKIEPNDEKLEAWHSSNLLRMQKFVNGQVDEEILDWIVRITEASPVFHLFNALTVSSDYDFGKEREDRIFKIVELMNSTDSPCFPPIKFLRKGEAKKCNTTKKTPFAMQGTSVYMGDSYLKKAIEVQKNDPEKTEEYLNKALSIYRRPKIFKPLKTLTWKLKSNLNHRIQLAKNMKKGIDIPSDFFQSKGYQDIYTCKSCHDGGKARDVLKINLP